MSSESKTAKSPKKFSLWFRQILGLLIVGMKNFLPYVPFIAVICAIIFVENLTIHYKEVGLRYIGMLFQIIGFIVVLRQLEGRLQIFRKPSVLSNIIAYLRRFPSRKVKIHNVSAQSISTQVTIGQSGSAHARLVPGPDSSLERRIKILEDDIENIREDINTMEKIIVEHKSGNEKSLKEMQQESAERFEKLTAFLDEAFVSRIRLERVGVWYFLVGVILVTIAPEIAVWSG